MCIILKAILWFPAKQDIVGEWVIKYVNQDNMDEEKLIVEVENHKILYENTQSLYASLSTPGLLTIAEQM